MLEHIQRSLLSYLEGWSFSNEKIFMDLTSWALGVQTAREALRTFVGHPNPGSGYLLSSSSTEPVFSNVHSSQVCQNPLILIILHIFRQGAKRAMVQLKHLETA